MTVMCNISRYLEPTSLYTAKYNARKAWPCWNKQQQTSALSAEGKDSALNSIAVII